MLIRIVRMHFKEDAAEVFLNVFNENKLAIRNFKGCSHLELLKDVKDNFCYTTLSYWQRYDDLEAYRNSEIFNKVWSSVKPLFSERPQAFSLEKYIEV